MSDSNRGTRSPALSLANAARALKLFALLFFFLPWATVSCADQTLISMSGMELATGTATAHNPLTGETATPPSAGKPDLPVLAAALLIAAAMVLSFVLARSQAPLVSIAALAVAAALICYTVLVRIPAQVRVDASAQAAQGASRMNLADVIRVETAPGFWLTLAALIAAIALTWMASREAPPG